MRVRISVFVAAAAVALAVSSCARSTSQLRPAPLSTEPVVYSDGFYGGLDFQAFRDSKLDAISIDTAEKYRGTTSIKVTVPAPGATSAGFAGGAFTTTVLRDLSGYNALTFWAKSSVGVRLDVAGLGNDNTGTSKYEAKWGAIQLTTSWKQYVLPIPAPERLAAEGGLFFFAEGPKGTGVHYIWFDEIQFEKVKTIRNPRPSMATKTFGTFVGATVVPEATQTIFSVDGSDQKIEHMSGYFTYSSSNAAVVRASGGTIKVVGGGTATVTATLGTVPVTGSLTISATAPPSNAAPTPTVPAANVISLFSNAYPNVTVDKWSADWDVADVDDLKIAGNDTKIYKNLVYAGIEFITQTIDASAMTHLHLDVWVPSGTVFKIKLVDFGADGVFSGGDDSEHRLTFDAGSTPPLATSVWIGFDIPLASFTGLAARGHLAQLIIEGDTPTVYVDNIYFHK